MRIIILFIYKKFILMSVFSPYDLFNFCPFVVTLIPNNPHPWLVAKLAML